MVVVVLLYDYLIPKVLRRGSPNRRTPNVIMIAEYDVRLNRDGDAQMKYILMDYVNEAGWPQLTRAEQQPWLGACKAFMEAMTDGAS